MKCARCGKPLTVAALSIPTKDGAVNFGPKCARSILPGKPRRVAVPKVPAVLVEVDPRQIPLFLSVGIL